MGVGQNYVLDKGYLATGATAYATGEIAKATAGSGAFASTLNTVARATTATTNATAAELLVVVMEDLDTVRLGTGKAFINCAILGLARVQVGASVTAGSYVTNDATARAVPVTKATAGAIPTQCLGIAMTGNTTVGGFIDVLLTPGASF